METTTIKIVHSLLDKWQKELNTPHKCLLAFDSKSQKRIAVDNRTNNFRIEEFESKKQAESRLRGEFEVA